MGQVALDIAGGAASTRGGEANVGGHCEFCFFRHPKKNKEGEEGDGSAKWSRCGENER